MLKAHWKDRLLPLLILFLHLVNVCHAAICMFDVYMRATGLHKIAAAAPQLTYQDWEPIRIVASTKDLLEPSKYCAKSDGLILERGTVNAEAECTIFFGTITSEQNTIALGILEKAIALHADRLLVQRVVGPLVIPYFSTKNGCKYFNIPEEHHTAGVKNADMVLYVSLKPKKNQKAASMSSGLTCAKAAGGRPIAGGLTFESVNIVISRHTVRITAHQIAHALGFSYDEMKSHNMISNYTVRGKTSFVAMVKSDKTRKMAQEQYGCLAARGMELEDGGNNVVQFSHWERRNAKDELMATPTGGPGISFMGFYTSLTMAVFEDLGYYKANFQMAEHMQYGYKAGCDFLDGKCMVMGKTKWPNMFCDVSESHEKSNVCTTDRFGLGGCAVTDDYHKPLPIQFRYFRSTHKGGLASSLTDYCPVVEQDPTFVCINSEQQRNMPGSIFSKNSMCLDGNALQVKTESESVSVGAVCAEISCEGGSVRVKYHGDNNTWHKCPEGKSLTPSSTSDSFQGGTIKCPKYKEVCTVPPDGSSLVPKATYKPIESSTNPSSGSQSGRNSKDSSPVPFGLIPSVCVFVFLFAEYIIT